MGGVVKGLLKYAGNGVFGGVLRLAEKWLVAFNFFANCVPGNFVSTPNEKCGAWHTSRVAVLNPITNTCITSWKGLARVRNSYADRPA
ncbi:Uncharacterised protein [Corynebacterium amycolatum]|nr:Uncharacterised protein [Corynebacterium amycolatum]